MIIACTLDYDWWPRYVVAALVSLFGGVVILLPFKLAWHVLERRRRRRRPTTATRLQSTLCQLQSSAERITAGNSPINKTIVSSFSLLIIFTRKIVSEMTYNVSNGMLNPTIPYHTIPYRQIGGGICFCPCLFVCLSARLLKNACMDLDDMLRVDSICRVGT